MQKQLWKQIVFSKIQNQSNLLTLLNLGVDPLKTYYSSIKSGDSTNREGVAARIYWKKLFGKELTRDRYGNPPNNMLNYGYAILRANVARVLIGRGLLLEIGIFHKNRFDPMPLADDMMEPFRPFVDEVVWHLYQAGKCDIDKDFKYAIMEIFYRRLQFETLVDMADSLVRIYCGEAGTLIFKSICQ